MRSYRVLTVSSFAFLSQAEEDTLITTATQTWLSIQFTQLSITEAQYAGTKFNFQPTLCSSTWLGRAQLSITEAFHQSRKATVGAGDC